MAVASAKKTKKLIKKNVPVGVASVYASFNNVRVTITDSQGNVIAWSSAGKNGFKGSRKATIYSYQRSGFWS
jgi:small subunit ribosomal protein S11